MGSRLDQVARMPNLQNRRTDTLRVRDYLGVEGVWVNQPRSTPKLILRAATAPAFRSAPAVIPALSSPARTPTTGSLNPARYPCAPATGRAHAPPGSQSLKQLTPSRPNPGPPAALMDCPGGQAAASLEPIMPTRTYLIPVNQRLEKDMATHSSILAWRIPWTEEPGRLSSP